MDHKRIFTSESIIIKFDKPDNSPVKKRRKEDSTGRTIIVIVACLLFSATLGYAVVNEYYYRKSLDRETRTVINDSDITDLDAQREEIRDEYVELLTAHINSQKIKIIPGNFNACQQNGWHYACIDNQRKIVGIMQWEITSIATVLVNNDINIDVNLELDTILVYKRFLSLVDVRYRNRKEFRRRYYNFRSNKIHIETHNARKDKMYTMIYTGHSDESQDEIEGFSSIFKGRSNDIVSNGSSTYEYNMLRFTSKRTGYKAKGPEEIFDWRNHGIVKGAIDQGTCGSCWAISAADAVSMFYSIGDKSNETFSSQQLLDCTSSKYSCTGGSLYHAMLYASANLLCKEGEYPYKGMKGNCESKKCQHRVQKNNIKKLKNADIREHLLKHGPIVASFTISRDFLFYGEGIFDGSCKGKISHSIVIVGYGYDINHKTKYWIIKNSWGSGWGESGFFKMVDEVVNKEYYCSIRSYAYGLEANPKAT
ncbi:Papain family cysteine protease family member protein [Theileria equi strain WA]|uniref:Papain family cysteine protease family member protein n=1 Tax=Theileria equi strain WA TaxID=1537102 RepID=L0ATW1_THEEQ|nr:Papain family cysteine protease family member protein [Theileria equi strain WA]AFZ78980.1 Papain family cysteine protease family member protein [Theileria equi strain WA]|eukprot:XP_004828646.1 Papain family cysteine protease family member protein [Theileria equi strain WA]